MATLTTLDIFRQMIGDSPVHAFNEATSDGENASWVLTNKPVVQASDSLFLNGELQQNGTSYGILNADVELGGRSATISEPTSYNVGDQITFENVPDPFKLQIVTVDDGTGVITFNRKLDKHYAASSTTYKIAKDYTIDYDNGIVFFTVAPTLGTKLTVRFLYAKYSNDYLASFLEQASGEVTIDIGETPDIDNNIQHRVLVFLKAHIYLLNEQITKGASSAIKIRQGSTSLDLVGSTSALKDQMKMISGNYSNALLAYLNGQLEGSLGSAVLGQINANITGG